MICLLTVTKNTKTGEITEVYEPTDDDEDEYFTRIAEVLWRPITDAILRDHREKTKTG